MEFLPQGQTVENACDQSSGNCAKKEETGTPSQNKDINIRSEQRTEEKKILPESINDASNDKKDSAESSDEDDKKSSESIKKFDSDEDEEEETDDEVTVEAEPDDE
ncbi:MAG: hypothetical protein ACD_15C00024G0006 [uncultured bacterium]|nr:MAG: hypothetical protein ACD_15C00024G0006 [uncultured bacterium]